MRLARVFLLAAGCLLPLYLSAQAAPAMPEGGAQENMRLPAGERSFNGLVQSNVLELSGDGTFASTLRYTGNGTAFQSAMDRAAHLRLRDFQIVGNPAATGPCIELTNATPDTARGYSSSDFVLSNVRVSHCSRTEGGIKLWSKSPEGAVTSNAYGFLLTNAQASFAGSYGLKVAGDVGTPVVTVLGGLFEGNTNNVVFGGGGRGFSSIVHFANMNGMNLQGAQGVPFLVEHSILSGTLMNTYFEQTNNQPAIKTQDGGTLRGFTMIGNQFGTSPNTPPAYIVQQEFNGVGNMNKVVSLGNVLGSCTTAAYKLSNVASGLIGFGDAIVGHCPAHFDWNAQYSNLWAWDEVNKTFTGSSDTSITDSPRFGVGVKGNAVKAMLHVGAQRTPKPAPQNGVAAVSSAMFVGGNGGDTTGVRGEVAGKGAGETHVTGNGGSAAYGAVNGDGGDFLLQLGHAGTGQGKPGSDGKLVVKDSAGETRATIEASGKGMFNGGISVPATSSVTLTGASGNRCVRTDAAGKLVEGDCAAGGGAGSSSTSPSYMTYTMFIGGPYNTSAVRGVAHTPAGRGVTVVRVSFANASAAGCSRPPRIEVADKAGNSCGIEAANGVQNLDAAPSGSCTLAGDSTLYLRTTEGSCTTAPAGTGLATFLVRVN